MRFARLLGILAAFPLLSGCALKHVFVAAGPSRLPYQGRALHPAMAAMVGITVPQLPGWGVAYAIGETHPNDSASYVVPNCYSTPGAGTQVGTPFSCRPRIVEQERSLAVHYRWQPARAVHPLASAAFGQLKSSYEYGTFGSPRSDSVRQWTFMTLTGGAELSLNRWLHASVSAGYRAAPRKVMLAGTSSNSGFLLTSLLLIGVPNRGQPGSVVP